MSGLKYDQGKTRYDLIPPEVLEAIGRILTYGAEKYGDRNWEQGGIGYSRYFAALMRHMWSYHSGEQLDPESGMSHLWHAACNIAMMIATVERSELASKDPGNQKPKKAPKSNGHLCSSDPRHPGTQKEKLEPSETSRELHPRQETFEDYLARRFCGFPITERLGS